MAEDDLANLAPVAAAAWLYLVRRDREAGEVLSVLSLCDRECPVVVSPLLIDLTVDREFVGTVRTPMSCCDDGVLTRVTSFCPFVFLFYGTEDVLSSVEDHGDVRRLCEESRRRFGVRPFAPRRDREPTDVAALCRRLHLDPERTLGYVACGNGLKEMLYAGQLVPCLEEAVSVQIRSREGFKVPLYPATLFVPDGGRGDESGADASSSFGSSGDEEEEFVKQHGLYVPALSECLYYFVFTSWGQCMRVVDTARLIDAGRRQFVEDSQLKAKLAPFKRYHGYGSQKLSLLERDQLMVMDVVSAELAFSYSSVYFDSYYEPGGAFDFSEWPVVKSAVSHGELVERLRDLQMHLSTHVGALFFANNSVVYQTRIGMLSAAGLGGSGGGGGLGGGGLGGLGGHGGLGGGARGSGGGNVYATRESLLRSVRFVSGLTAMYEEALSDSKRPVPFEGTFARDDAYGPCHLAYFCGTCPQLVSSVVWYFNRMGVYSTGVSGDHAVYQHVVHSVGNLCEACGGRCCHTCYATPFVRMHTRWPQIPKAVKKEPTVATLVARPFADVGILGNFGRRFGPEPRDNGDAARSEDPGKAGVPGSGVAGAHGGPVPATSLPASGVGGGPGAGGGPGGVGGGATIDRMKHLNQVLDYCKKNSLIDPSTGEDVFVARSKREFVSVIGNLNRVIDESVFRLAAEVRAAGQGPDEIAGCTQFFNLDLNPFTQSFSPLLAYQYYRVVFAILQNLALINASGYVVDNPLTVPQVSRWVNQHFQVIAGAFAATPLKKGFLHLRDTKILKSMEFELLMDFRAFASAGCYVKKSASIKACKMSVRSLVSCRIKNRAVCRSLRGPAATFYKRHAQRKLPIQGGLAFLLYRCHDRMFPNCEYTCLNFWHRVFQNSLPDSVDIGDREEFDALVRFLLAATNEYDENDVIETPPDCIANYVEYRFHNRFLGIFGLRDYLSTIQALGTRLVVQNRMHCPYLLSGPPKFGSVAEYTLEFKKMKLEGVPAPKAAVVRRESALRTVFDTRSLITVSFSLEKFTGGMGTRDIFQFGQVAYYVGSGVERSLSTISAGAQDFRGLRQRSLLVTRLVDLLVGRSWRDSVTYDSDVVRSRVLAALDGSDPFDPDVEATVIAEIMAGRDGEVPEVDDVSFFVDDQEHVAALLREKILALVARGVVDFSAANLREVLTRGSGGTSSSTGRRRPPVLRPVLGRGRVRLRRGRRRPLGQQRRRAVRRPRRGGGGGPGVRAGRTDDFSAVISSRGEADDAPLPQPAQRRRGRRDLPQKRGRSK
ncbi:pR57 [rat cytomegalovirus strain Maastricht]|uniref:PR57 n=1 Tax=Rat cytomegalovirus (strain Maastricht) TaxID=79700 RepID=Q85425_RCMVM|nr:pR57 [rat cytomegalovirus strain Maastricht]AAC56430.1 pR57 [rat cytomegalovirus strain Maastricht]